MSQSTSGKTLLAAAGVMIVAAASAHAGGYKFHHGKGHYSSKVPTYLTETLDEAAQDDGSPGNMWVGSGIPATNFVLRNYDRTGIELAIKAHYRTGHDILPTFVDEDGLVHVEVPAGHQVIDPEHGVSEEREDRARWNFTFSYNVALDPDNGDLEDYSGWLLIDVDPSTRARYLPLRLTKLTDTPSGQESGYGWALKKTVAIPDDEGTSQVTQNSQNLAFYEDYIDADPKIPGKQSYADTDYGPGQFDVILILEPGHRHGKTKTMLHVVFDVVEDEAP